MKFKRIGKYLKRFKYPILGVFLIFNIWFWFFALPKPLFSTPTSTILYSENGSLLGATIAQDEQWRFPKNDSIPNRFKTCILSFEDAYYYKHFGVNPVSLGRALKQNIGSGKTVSGGSTISMQTIRLAKNNPKRTYTEKVVEMFQAIRLEFGYSKKEILLNYVSNAPFGGNVVGLDAASWRYYGKLPSQLSWGESATLAVLPNAPSLIYPGKNQIQLLKKRNRLLKKLYETEKISKEDYNLAILEPLQNKPNPLPQKAVHLVQTAAIENTGKRIVSTIDIDLQEQLIQTINIHHKQLKNKEIHNAAALVIEIETGNVKAYVGNTFSKQLEHSNAVDIINAPRSSGSILKPFLYDAMLADGKLLPYTLLNDTPSDITTNFNQQYDGAVPADDALARSLNIPAIDMLRRYGVEKFHHQLKKIGFSTFYKPANYYGLSLIVGGGEVSLWEVSRAYRNLAYQINHNKEEKFVQEIQYFKPKEEQKKERSPFQPQSAYLTIKAMQKLTRPNSEIGWQLFNKNKIAWKTGTSHGFKDAWAVGFNKKYLVGVWVGNADGEGRPGIVGVKAAAPILFDVFNKLPQTNEFNEPKDGFINVETCKHSGYKFGKNCEEIKMVKVPLLGKNMEACPFHIQIHLNKEQTHLVNSNCYAVAEMHSEKRFTLPAVQEWYYKKKNPWYKSIPTFLEGCFEEYNKDFDFIYPKNFTQLFLPTNHKGERQSVIFEVAHRTPETSLNWYLDGSFIGTTKSSHKMPLSPEQGKHQLILTDENGNQIQKSFTVVE